jgi:hypothetical protein
VRTTSPSAAADAREAQRSEPANRNAPLSAMRLARTTTGRTTGPATRVIGVRVSPRMTEGSQPRPATAATTVAAPTTAGHATAAQAHGRRYLPRPPTRPRRDSRREHEPGTRRATRPTTTEPLTATRRADPASTAHRGTPCGGRPLRRVRTRRAREHQRARVSRVAELADEQHGGRQVESENQREHRWDEARCAPPAASRLWAERRSLSRRPRGSTRRPVARGRTASRRRSHRPDCRRSRAGTRLRTVDFGRRQVMGGH